MLEVPQTTRLGRPRADARAVFEAILFLLPTGIQGKCLPGTFPPKATVHDHRSRWSRSEACRKLVARMIEKHWPGIAAYCQPDNKVSLGYVEGLNNKIRVIQRRAYGLRDEEYLRLKVLSCTLPEI